MATLRINCTSSARVSATTPSGFGDRYSTRKDYQCFGASVNAQYSPAIPNEWRLYLKFANLAIPAGATVTKAVLYLAYNSSVQWYGRTEHQAFKVYKASKQWTSASDFNQYDDSPYAPSVGSWTTAATFGVDITNLISNWNNNGLVIKVDTPRIVTGITNKDKLKPVLTANSYIEVTYRYNPTLTITTKLGKYRARLDNIDNPSHANDFSNDWTNLITPTITTSTTTGSLEVTVYYKARTASSWSHFVKTGAPSSFKNTWNIFTWLGSQTINDNVYKAGINYYMEAVYKEDGQSSSTVSIASASSPLKLAKPPVAIEWINCLNSISSVVTENTDNAVLFNKGCGYKWSYDGSLNKNMITAETNDIDVTVNDFYSDANRIYTVAQFSLPKAIGGTNYTVKINTRAYGSSTSTSQKFRQIKDLSKLKVTKVSGITSFGAFDDNESILSYKLNETLANLKNYYAIELVYGSTNSYLNASFTLNQKAKTVRPQITNDTNNISIYNYNNNSDGSGTRNFLFGLQLCENEFDLAKTNFKGTYNGEFHLKLTNLFNTNTVVSILCDNSIKVNFNKAPEISNFRLQYKNGSSFYDCTQSGPYLYKGLICRYRFNLTNYDANSRELNLENSVDGINWINQVTQKFKPTTAQIATTPAGVVIAQEFISTEFSIDDLSATNSFYQWRIKDQLTIIRTPIIILPTQKIEIKSLQTNDTKIQGKITFNPVFTVSTSVGVPELTIEKTMSIDINEQQDSSEIQQWITGNQQAIEFNNVAMPENWTRVTARIRAEATYKFTYSSQQFELTVNLNSSNAYILYNLLPTITYGKNQIGINANNFDDNPTVQPVVLISEKTKTTGQSQCIRFIGTDSLGKTIQFDYRLDGTPSSYPLPINQGGTGANNKQQALANLFDQQVLASKANLNTLVLPGCYVATSAVAATVLNTPINNPGFTLYVVSNAAGKRVTQLCIKNQSAASTWFIRYQDTNAYWTNWKQLLLCDTDTPHTLTPVTDYASSITGGYINYGPMVYIDITVTLKSASGATISSIAQNLPHPEKVVALSIVPATNATMLDYVAHPLCAQISEVGNLAIRRSGQIAEGDTYNITGWYKKA